MAIGAQQSKPGAHAAGRADGTEKISRLVALIARRGGSAAAPRPNAGQAAVLADAIFHNVIISLCVLGIGQGF